MPLVLLSAAKSQPKRVMAPDEDIIARLACQVSIESHLYDLRELNSDYAYQLAIPDTTMTLNFNFCEQLG